MVNRMRPGADRALRTVGGADFTRIAGLRPISASRNGTQPFNGPACGRARQVIRGWKNLQHIQADLCHDHMRSDVTDAWDGARPHSG
jgi:hypothetical protein